MHKNTNVLVKAIRFATLAAVAAPATVMAGGFSLNEQSASQMGVANAGAAANPENATTVFFNPAGMSQLSGTNISFGAAVLDIDAEAKHAEARRNVPGVNVPVNGNHGGDIADLAVLPNFYLTHEVNESIDVGFGIHAPYGLAADYDDNFEGRYFADKTELKAIAFTPSLSVNNGKGLSMGVGLNIMYAEGRLTKFQDVSAVAFRQGAQAGAQQAVTQLLTANPNATPQQIAAAQQAGAQAGSQQALNNLPADPYADIEGDDIGVTFRVGFLYELDERTQFGLSAQTGTELKLKGDAEISNFPVPGNPGATTTLTEKVEVPLAIPEAITFGVRHHLTDEVTLLAGATYARWGRFEELDINSREGDSGQISQVTGRTGDEPVTHITEKWKNTWQVNVGGIWQATPEWAFKAGYAWDESPVDQYLTARIPSSDRHWLTLGTQWKDAQSGWAVDVAVGTLLFKDDPKFTERNYQHSNPDQVAELAPGIEDPSYYTAEYELSAWSAAIEVSKAF
ncbi:MAG: aromatic hydrocarbon degradation protein [Gammaproteobacteria bacterium]|uniref:Putative outer membrane protein n=1 Tax=Marinobacter litoralis TaxID=187981 RepID=A0A3M2RB92_9GAMM|nr:outer membrane protein transport protein [Marinobacter litoralis]MBR9870003.1 aromatic hydrocarbon degradation protein [Gammaproteobacteria bacterium]RMJ02557.1 putative outer membrane protein precursor [Marinobacter litoralis]